MKTISSEVIKKLVFQAGFDLCGLTRAEYLAGEEDHFREWLAAGYCSGMEYLERNQELRFDASKLVEGGRTVVVCGVNYKSEYSLNQGVSDGVGIASYGLMRDYHKTIRKRLKGVMMAIRELDNQITGRLFTDSAPLLEKHLAVRAGLGSIGRQSLLVTPEFGTYLLLGELVISCEVDRYDEPLGRDLCGSCHRCVESCPASAINPNRTLDTRRCIACRTIEHSTSGDGDLAGWIFGCEVCQNVCPHNQRTPLAVNPDMRPIVTPPTAAEWLSMTPERFDRVTQGTPIRRSSLEQIKENVLKNSR